MRSGMAPARVADDRQRQLHGPGAMPLRVRLNDLFKRDLSLIVLIVSVHLRARA